MVGAGAFGLFLGEVVEVFARFEALENTVGGGLFEFSFLGGATVMEE